MKVITLMEQGEYDFDLEPDGSAYVDNGMEVDESEYYRRI